MILPSHGNGLELIGRAPAHLMNYRRVASFAIFQNLFQKLHTETRAIYLCYSMRRCFIRLKSEAHAIQRNARHYYTRSFRKSPARGLMHRRRYTCVNEFIAHEKKSGVNY